jgi:hypothetical protein
MITLLFSLAAASPVYPSTLVTDLSIPCTPACTVCHASNAGGSGTVTSDFGVAMMGQGMNGGSDTTSLQAALTAMTSSAVDSDGDGVIDTEQLTAGIDPSTGTDFCGGDPLPTPPHYGCGKSSSAALLFGVLFGARSLRRKQA